MSVSPVLNCTHGETMTDLKATRLCAEAMGYADYTPHCAWYQPLHDDEQCMELVKRFMLEVDAFSGMAKLQSIAGQDSFQEFSDESLNHAVVYCVAKMQAAKIAPIRDRTHGGER